MNNDNVAMWNYGVRCLFLGVNLHSWMYNPTLLHLMPSAGIQVRGVTTHGNEIFVVRAGIKYVQVYKTADFTVTRQIAVA